MSAGDCCKKAKLDLKLDYGSHGGVICCDGKMIACNWWWPHDDQIKARAKEKKLPHPPSAEVEGMIADCMTKHEQAHFGVTPPCDKKQKGIDRPDPNFKGTDAEKEEQKKAEEREKNQEELDCINKKKCKDPNDTNCNGWLKSRKEHLRDNVRLYGGNPKG